MDLWLNINDVTLAHEDDQKFYFLKEKDYLKPQYRSESAKGLSKYYVSTFRVFVYTTPVYTSSFSHYILDPISSCKSLFLHKKFGQYIVIWMMI